MDALREARKIARRRRAELRDGGEFTQAEFLQAIHGDLRHLEDDAYEAFVAKVGEDVDRESKKDRVDDQLTLPGHDFDLGGEYHMGDGRRIAKRLATIDHAETSLAIDDENLMAVQHANLRKRKEILSLRPFWGRNVTKQKAVDKYREANPTDA